MMPNLVKEYEAYCQWQYDLAISFPRGRNAEVIEKKIQRILGAGQLSKKLIKEANGGLLCTKTDQEQEEIRNIYKKFKEMLESLLTNE
jgi:CO dehydrogenase/acetyl-CoA synthase epsilon subunit